MAIYGTDKGGALKTDLPFPLIKSSASANFTVSSAGAAVTLSFATVDAGSYIAGRIECGYDAAPTGGYVRITDYAGNVYWRIPITSAGAAFFDLSDLTMPISTGIKVGMGGGGGAVLGYLAARPHVEY
jgi:hypothetical protein